MEPASTSSPSGKWRGRLSFFRAGRGNLTNALSGLVVILLVLAIGQTWWVIVQDRELVLKAESENSDKALRLVAEHAEQTVREAERNLDEIIYEIGYESERVEMDEAHLRALIGRVQPFNQVLKALQFSTPQGKVFVGPIAYPAFQTDADDRTYFPYLHQNADKRELHIGTPFKRYYDNELIVPVAKNVYDAKHRYLGVLSTDISIAYFFRVYAKLSGGDGSFVSLISDSGKVIVRVPEPERFLGQAVPVSGRLAHMVRQREGHFVDDSFLANDRVERTYSFLHVPQHGITAIYARNTASVLSDWRKRSIDRIVFTVLVTSALIGLTLLLRKYVGNLVRSEGRLLESEAQLRRSERMFSLLFSESPVPLALIDLESDAMIEANQRYLSQFHCRRDQVIGRTPIEMALWNRPERRRPYLEQLKANGRVDELEVQLCRADGGVLTCHLSARVIDINGKMSALFAPIDITALRAVEEAMTALNHELEERVRQRTLTLQRANAELAQTLDFLTKAQTQLMRSEKMAALGALVAGVSHELNTPIGTCLTAGSTLDDNCQALVTYITAGRPQKNELLRKLEENSRIAEILLRNLKRAGELVNSFKQIAVDQSGNVRREFELRHTIEEILRALRPMCRKANVVLEVDLPPETLMDSYPGALAQILTGLLSNAIVHGFEGRDHGTVQVSAFCPETHLLELHFRDDGVGISEANLHRVCEPFFTTQLGQGSCGLGMSVIYNLVTELLGGTLEITSERGNGTLVIIRLPLKAPPLPVTPAPQKVEAQSI